MMNKMTSAEVRSAFLDYFQEVGHTIVASSPLPNYDNPTLLFTNAGMNQFADVFLGKEQRDYRRAVTSQKCMRVSGKHNDLENVGYSLRHHTFFEMLGNFSFGDYFKKEAINYAWVFLTGVCGFEPERLWATIYTDDDEAFALWQAYLPAEKIRRFGKKENYWEMGDVGPCGPCSEIHYYQGDLAVMMEQAHLLNNDADSAETFLEVWNLVFMQFERDPAGNVTPLPKPSIDTGMGLERICRLLQGAANNYESDLFMPAIDKVQAMLGHSDAQKMAHIVGYRVIADHGRAATFLIGDGVIPGNTAAPYVLRMVIRRAARFGRKLGFSQPFLAEIAQVYIETLGGAYPDIRQRADFIKQTITQEELRFARALNVAETRFVRLAEQLKGGGETVIPGNIAFDLFSTNGLPLEITRDLAQEYGLQVDEKGYYAAKQAHAVTSGSGAFGQYDVSEQSYGLVSERLIAQGLLDRSGVDYDPYNATSAQTTVLALFQKGQEVREVSADGGEVEILTVATPFYVESGGEVSDTGKMVTPQGVVFVLGMVKKAGLILHLGRVLSGKIGVGDSADLQVDEVRRADIRRNHTATHILHRELRAKLGTHVTQQGSLVTPDRLRFDFSHPQAVSAEQLAEIEQKINAALVGNERVSAEYMQKEEAIGRGAMALFGEKYGDIVRTIQIGPDGAYSFELCGGLHVAQTGDIGAFHFVSEESVASGVRRVEAVTGAMAQEYVSSRFALLRQIAHVLDGTPHTALEKAEQVVAQNRQLQKELEQLRLQWAKMQFDQQGSAVQMIGDVPLFIGRFVGVTIETLREVTHWFFQKERSGVAVASAIIENRPFFVCAVSDDLIKRGVKAGDLARELGKRTGGGGGGRPNLAEAGGKEVQKSAEALLAVPALVREKLGQG